MRRCSIYTLGIALAIFASMLFNDIIVGHLMATAKGSEAYKMYRLYKQSPENEIAILGSSRAEVCISPLDISTNCFNYGISGSSFSETVFHLSAVLARQNVRVAIINVDPWGVPAWNYRADYRLVADVPIVRDNRNVNLTLKEKLPLVRFCGDLRTVLPYVFTGGGGSKIEENGAILTRIQRTREEWEYVFSQAKNRQFSNDADVKKQLMDLVEE